MPAAAPGDDEFCIPVASEDAFIEAFNDPCTQRRCSGYRATPNRRRSRYSGYARQLHLSHVQQLEILAGDGIFVPFAQEAHIVRIFQIFEPGGIAPSLLYVAPNRSRVLHPAMDHLFFPVAPHPEGNGRRKRSGGNGHQRHEQHEQQQNVAALGPAMPARMEMTRAGSGWSLVVGRWSLALRPWHLIVGSLS